MRLASHGKRFAIGAFLGPDERETLAVRLAAALAKARADAGRLRPRKNRVASVPPAGLDRGR